MTLSELRYPYSCFADYRLLDQGGNLLPGSALVRAMPPRIGRGRYRYGPMIHWPYSMHTHCVRYIPIA
jgi:hypothetical protein